MRCYNWKNDVKMMFGVLGVENHIFWSQRCMLFKYGRVLCVVFCVLCLCPCDCVHVVVVL